jgi:hypothetical protein
MLQKLIRTGETCLFTALAVTAVCSAAWGGPPPPPVILAQLPATPLGGAETSIATAAGIAAYGWWKSRR